MRWTEEEKKALDVLGSSYRQTGKLPRQKDYASLANKYGRSLSAVISMFRNTFVDRLVPISSEIGRRRWSAKEDDALLTAVMIYGAWSWKKIARFVGSRTWLQCYRRYRTIKTPVAGRNMPQNQWTRMYKHSIFLDKRYPQSNQGEAKIKKSTIFQDVIMKHDEALQVVQPGGVITTTKYPQDTGLIDNRELVMPFDNEEDELIFRLCRLYGHRWKLIAHMINLYLQRRAAEGGENIAMLKLRSSESVHQHFRQIAGKIKETHIQEAQIPAKTIQKPARGKRMNHTWVPEEDQRLKGAVSKVLNVTSQPFSWKAVAREMGGALHANQCRARWMDFLGSYLKHTPFTENEDRILWPFVVASFDKASEGYYSYITTTIRQKQPSGEVIDISLGRVVSSQLPQRSRYTVRSRITRMKLCIMWLQNVVKVESPLDHFDLVRKLVDSPIAMRHKVKNK
ncbi:hypothetical protein IWW36_000581 [Coemansia brasiliensis]|uniref:Uncharacterized protein n=1 Tax=Coemansia brasiliensis TaxID=2650707 RepID=A0A9W8IDA0_9FUNG|nr:hypothetical protein IWW36_000581 [Coemansia brasiliensis]